MGSVPRTLWTWRPVEHVTLKMRSAICSDGVHLTCQVKARPGEGEGEGEGGREREGQRQRARGRERGRERDRDREGARGSGRGEGGRERERGERPRERQGGEKRARDGAGRARRVVDEHPLVVRDAALMPPDDAWDIVFFHSNAGDQSPHGVYALHPLHQA